MTQAMNDGGAISPPDYLNDYVNAFRAGQASTPTAAAAPNPTLDQLTNAVTGRLALADGAQRNQAARRAELLGAIGAGLSGVPYAQRVSILAHLAPALAGEGIPPQTVTGFDPTDEALAASVSQAHAATKLVGGA